MQGFELNSYSTGWIWILHKLIMVDVKNGQVFSHSPIKLVLRLAGQICQQWQFQH